MPDRHKPEVKAAWVGALAGALAAALVAGIFSLVVAERQNEDQRTLASVAFQREQRGDAYIDFLSADRQFEFSLTSFGRKYARSQEVTAQAITPVDVYADVDESRKKRNELDQYLSEVRVFGSDDAVSQANSIVSAYPDLDALEAWALDRVQNLQQPGSFAEPPLGQVVIDREARREDLEHAAREDAQMRIVPAPVVPIQPR
jgi:hypothetical protein